MMNYNYIVAAIETSDLFDGLVKSADSNEDMADYQKKVNAAFNALKKIFCDLEW